MENHLEPFAHIYMYIYIIYIYFKPLSNIVMYLGNAARKKGILFGCYVGSLYSSGFPTNK